MTPSGSATFGVGVSTVSVSVEPDFSGGPQSGFTDLVLTLTAVMRRFFVCFFRHAKDNGAFKAVSIVSITLNEESFSPCVFSPMQTRLILAFFQLP